MVLTAATVGVPVLGRNRDVYRCQPSPDRIRLHCVDQLGRRHGNGRWNRYFIRHLQRLRAAGRPCLRRRRLLYGFGNPYQNRRWDCDIDCNRHGRGDGARCAQQSNVDPHGCDCGGTGPRRNRDVFRFQPSPAPIRLHSVDQLGRRHGNGRGNRCFLRRVGRLRAAGRPCLRRRRLLYGFRNHYPKPTWDCDIDGNWHGRGDAARSHRQCRHRQCRQGHRPPSQWSMCTTSGIRTL